MAENLYTEQMVKEERQTETTTALNYAPVVRTEILNVPQAIGGTATASVVVDNRFIGALGYPSTFIVGYPVQLQPVHDGAAVATTTAGQVTIENSMATFRAQQPAEFRRERWEPQAAGGAESQQAASAVPQDLVARSNNRETPPGGVQTVTVQTAPAAAPHRPSNRRSRGGDNVKFQCNSCSRSFSQPNALLKHAEIHTKEGSFMCSLCNKSYSSSYHLKVHARIHTGEKPFTCTLCNKPFGRKEHLQRHTLTHTKERPFQCPVCNKLFPVKSSLQRHMLTHNGGKPL